MPRTSPELPETIRQKTALRSESSPGSSPPSRSHYRQRQRLIKALLKIDHIPSLVSDAALHLRSTTNPHNRTCPPERRHTRIQASGLKTTNQPRISTCRTARVCNIEDTLSQTSDAALHLVHTTNPHNQTHAPERKHPQLQRNKWRARTDSTVSITIELQQPQ